MARRTIEMEVKNRSASWNLVYGKKTIARNSVYQRTLLKFILTYHKKRMKRVPVDPVLKISSFSFRLVAANLDVKE
jgi:hypothetical protein